jgi:elongation factor P
MNTNTYDQIEINASQMGDAKKWLVGQEVCEIVLWNGQPISVSPPVIVELKIISSEPGIKGDTVSGAMKNATLETNINIQVPLFVNENEVIKVDTRNMTYVGRVKS